MRDNFLTVTAARIAGVPFRLSRIRAFKTPKKVLILKPCCVSQVLLTTPLLAVLAEAYPEARFDWAVSEWARPAVAGNPRITELIDSGRVGLGDASWREVRDFIGRLRAEGYDTCIIPSRSSLLALVAWRARVRQRIGLHVNGRGFAHTMPVRPGPEARHEAEVYLSLARALQLDSRLIARAGRMEFYPPDRDRTAMTARLVEEIDWLGETRLVLVHPGGARNPIEADPRKQWPVERFALLANHLARRHGAKIILVGAAADRPRAEAVLGLMSVPAVNLAGQIQLGELGALCEVADLYVGNDAGPTHIAAATGVPTLAIFGPSAPEVSGPYGVPGRVTALWRARSASVSYPVGVIEKEFSWDEGVSVEEAVAAADGLLARTAV